MPSTIRRMNKEIVLNTIKDMGPIARTDIAKETGITKATVSDIVKTLIEEKLIFDEKDDADLSKRGTRLHFAKNAAFGIAVDLGGLPSISDNSIWPANASLSIPLLLISISQAGNF